MSPRSRWLAEPERDRLTIMASVHTLNASADRRIARAGRGRLVPPIALGAALAALWQLACTVEWLPASISSPEEIVRYLWTVLRTSAAWETIGETMYSWAISFAITVVIGTSIGLLAGLSDIGRRMVGGLVEFCRPIPSIVFFPLVVLTFGTERKGIVLLVVLSAVWPVLIQTAAGVHDLDPVLWDVSRAYGIRWHQRLRRIVIPSAVPFVVTGVRIAATLALVVVITAELLGSGRGIGTELAAANQTGYYVQLYGFSCVAAGLGLAIDVVIGRIERRVLRWHPSQRGELS